MRKHLVALVLVLSLLSPVLGGTAASADTIDIYWTKHCTDTDLDGAAWCELMVNISSIPNWKLVDTSPEIARWSMGMAYDSNREVAVMFGGRDGGAPLADTWEYDGNSWYSVITSNAPAPRMWHAMAYDSARHRTVLFGGLAYGTLYGDTWEYDGENWQQITTSHSPPAMSQMSMVYDSWRNKIVVFGGQDYTGDLADTWEYDGTDWTKVDTSVSPPRGTLAAMAFDSARGKVVLFGSGVVMDPGPSDCATWEYDGITWTRVHTATSPPGRWAHTMAYDPARQRIVLFGGYGITYPSGSELDDTWEYDGTNWAPISVPTSPAARQQHGMTYHSGCGCVVMFGGIGPGGVSGETWEYRGVKPTIEATVDFDPDTLNLKSGGKVNTAEINIEAYIDGRSQLIITGNTVQWHHLDYAAPGRLEGADYPTVINDVDWYPVWPDFPDPENRWCDCNSSTYEELDPALPELDVGVELSIIHARYSIEIIQHPSVDNDYTLILEFDDNPPAGAAWYECELTVIWQRSKAPVTVYIELAEGYDVNDIDVGSVLLNGTVPAELRPTAVGDYDADGVPDLMVKFDRSAVQDMLEAGDDVEVTVSGELIDGTPFEGTDTIRVISQGK